MTTRIQAINMPKWGMSMSEGKLVKWLVDEGDEIANEQETLEIETDKITNVVESHQIGVLRRKVAEEGETLPVGALLGVIAESSVTDAEIDNYVETNKVSALEDEAEDHLTSSIVVDGRSIRIMDSGGDSETAVFLVHGFGGDLNNWLFNFDELSAQIRTVAIDLPGHGQSSKDVGDGSVDLLVSTVLSVVDELGLKKVHLAGHSMGGLVAAKAMLSKPDLVASMILLAPAGVSGSVNYDYVTSFIDADNRRALKPVLSSLFADPSVVTRDMVNDVLQYKRIDGVSDGLRVLAEKALGSELVESKILEQLATNNIPVSMLWGSEDQVIALPDKNTLGDNIQYMIIDGKGHMLHMEASKEVNSVILSHLDI